MEVMVGSSFGIGMAAYVRDRGGVTAAQDKAVQTALFLADESGRGGSQIGIGLRMSKTPEESSDSSSSSIGESSENEEEEEENDDVSYRGGGGTLDSFSSSLEDSLPIKRGLSNHYVGKSKSFGNLMEAASNNNAKDLEKFENPFNKRRRLVIANKLRMRGRSMSASNFYSWQNPNSMPLLALQEPNEDDDHHHHNDEYEDEDDDDDRRKMSMMMMKNKRDLMAQTRSCFCLSSLQEEDDGDVDDDE